MRIVSLNAWGGAYWDALAAWVPAVGADVLCLQEMIRAPQPSPAWLTYRDPYRELPQRADLFGDVSALLSRAQAAFAPAARGPLEDEAGQVYLSEHGLGAWVAPEWAISARWQGFAHGDFRADGWGPEPVPRAVQMMRIEAGAGASVVVAHFHGLRDPAGKGDSADRLAQAHAVVAALRDFARDGEGIVLGGDFNLLPDSACFEVFAQIGLRDLVTGQGISDTRTDLYKKPQRHANYMLVNDAVRVAHFEAPAQPVVSDHRPLVLDILN